MLNVSFIGSGNLAWHLAPALDNAEFAVKEIYSRQLGHAADLAGRLYQAQTKSDLDFSQSKSRVFILAVADDAIHALAMQLQLPGNAILVHTSGSQPLSLLGYSATPNIGVFYPLQTFTRGRKINFEDVPVFIEAENPETEKILMKMGKAIAKKVSRISSEERKALHLAAVFASNFTNHMLALSKALMDEHKLKYDLLKPLIAETINKSFDIGPEKAQTGPARRGDLAVLDKHMEFLKDDERLAELYRVVSQHIVDVYHRDED